MVYDVTKLYWTKSIIDIYEVWDLYHPDILSTLIPDKTVKLGNIWDNEVTSRRSGLIRKTNKSWYDSFIFPASYTMHDMKEDIVEAVTWVWFTD